MIEYGLKVTICTMVFSFIYNILMRRDTHFVLNRVFLLSAIVLSLTIPLVQFNIFNLSGHSPVTYESSVVFQRNLQIVESVVTEYQTVLSNSWAIPSDFISTKLFIRPLYLFVGLFLLVRFMMAGISLYRHFRSSPKVNYEKYSIIISDSITSPFSFFRWIFMNRFDLEDKPCLAVLMHEKAHSRQLHSLDILLIELFSIIFWFNPFVYMMKKAIRQNHEFLADSIALNSGMNITDYQQFLLRNPFRSTEISLVSSHEPSLIKQRFEMMSKRRSYSLSKAKSLILLPVILILLVGFSNATSQDSTNSSTNYNSQEPEIAYEENPDAIPALLTVPDLKPEDVEDFLPEAVRNAPTDINIELIIFVGVDGIPVHTKIVKIEPEGYDLETFVNEFYKRCTFEPATKNGKVVVAKLDEILTLK